MPRTGEVIENPVSGETIVFVKTGADTDGKLLQLDHFIQPDGKLPQAQLHPGQEKRFRVRRGWMMLRVDGKLHVLGAGDEAVVPAGIPHLWWNCGFEELAARVELRPAGRYDEAISSLFALAKAGQVDEWGDPGGLQMAVLLDEYRDTLRLLEYRSRLWRAMLPAMSSLGRLFGIRPAYPYPRFAWVDHGLEVWRSEALAGSRANPC